MRGLPRPIRADEQFSIHPEASADPAVASSPQASLVSAPVAAWAQAVSPLVEECAAVARARLAAELAAAEEARYGLALDVYLAVQLAVGLAPVDCSAVHLGDGSVPVDYSAVQRAVEVPADYLVVQLADGLAPGDYLVVQLAVDSAAPDWSSRDAAGLRHDWLEGYKAPLPAWPVPPHGL